MILHHLHLCLTTTYSMKGKRLLQTNNKNFLKAKMSFYKKLPEIKIFSMKIATIVGYHSNKYHAVSSV